MRVSTEKIGGAMSENIPDELDRKLLGIIQADFPLVSRPYLELGEKLGISEAEAFSRVAAMRESGLIRRLGANFQSSGLGFVSTLCAAKAPPEKIAEFVAAVNALPGVTHNYERDHAYNIWFTLISQSREESAAIIEDLSRRTGIPILNLPATRLYKIRVDFPMD